MQGEKHINLSTFREKGSGKFEGGKSCETA